MKDKQYVICGGITPHIENEALKNALRFHLYGQKDDEKLTLDIPRMRQKLFASIPTRFEDLLNIATYVFTADQSTTRGRNTAKNFDNDWYRNFHFFIPVRDLDFWQTPAVTECLQETLSFLSDDKYEFTFGCNRRFSWSVLRPQLIKVLTFQKIIQTKMPHCSY